MAIPCEQCGLTFPVEEFSTHKLNEHGEEDLTCYTCEHRFLQRSHLNRHFKSMTHKRRREDKEDVEPEEPPHKRSKDGSLFTVDTHASVFKGFVTVYRLTPLLEEGIPDIERYLQNAKEDITDRIVERIDTTKGLKFFTSIHVDMVKSTDEDTTTSPYFNGNVQIATRAGLDLGNQLDEAFEKIINSVEKFTREGSGWIIGKLNNIDLHVAEYTPVSGSSYTPVPPKLRHKKAIINVRNNDNRCFMWAVLSALHPVDKDPQRMSKYKSYVGELNFSNIDFPVKLANIPKFEQQNKIGIDVYGYNDETGLSLDYKTKSTSERMVQLLLLESNGKHHYCWIKDLDKLLNTQTKHNNRTHYCPKCVNNFHTFERLQKHIKLCKSDSIEQVIEMPEEDSIKFKNWHKALKIPLVMYADFECILEKKAPASAIPGTTSYTKNIQTHKPCGYGLVSVKGCCDEIERKISKPDIYRGEEAPEKMLRSIIEKSMDYQKQRDVDQKAIHMTSSDLNVFNTSRSCSICHDVLKPLHCEGKKWGERCLDCKSNTRVRDHCHICGKFRGAAHSRCNLKYRLNRDVVVVMHNLRRYDGHIIMQALGSLANEYKSEINVIPKGAEDYLTFSMVVPWKSDEHTKPILFNIKFIDSLAFMGSSLEKLASDLDAEDFKVLESCYPAKEDRDLLRKKGVYPYEYMNDWRRFNENQLPPQKAFYSTLTQGTISDIEYQHGKKVWSHFGIKSMGEYHDLYLKTDVLLLADVFEKFRSAMILNYGLDPAHYVSIPSFTWDACLKKTGVELELLQDQEMYEFCETGIRGGVAMISQRYAKANNEYMGKVFDVTKPSTYLSYLDANNLYGWAMSQSLPKDGFEWVEKPDDEINVYLKPSEGTGYFLEVDLEYPERLHALHNDYPLAPEKMLVEDTMLSPFSTCLKKRLSIKSGKVKKLVPNLRKKTKYIVHYQNLKLYTELGLKLTKIHRVLKFNEQPWMQSYIQFNTDLRTMAKSKFEKDLFKLMNNAVFGKTMENVRKYMTIKLVTNEKKAKKWINKANCSSFIALGENLLAIHLTRDVVELNKPIYVGFTVLDLSKYLMYDFHYNYIKEKYGEGAQLLFTDTDSLAYIVKTEDLYNDMKCDVNFFDTSDYPVDHFLHSTVNKKVIGKFKDEANGKIITEFVGLRAKMYSFLFNDGNEKKTGKGVSRCVVNQLRHSNYVNNLTNCEKYYHIMHSIRSVHHTLSTVEQCKVSLCCYDDKRYVLNDGKSTLAYGHKDIANQ